MKFHADHMPPNAVVKEMNEKWFRKATGQIIKQRFYPQCTKCSSKQGGILASASQELKHNMSASKRGSQLIKAGGGKQAHYHGLRFRTSHLAGALVAGTTIYGASENEIWRGNPKRFQFLFKDIESGLKKIHFENLFKDRY